MNNEIKIKRTVSEDPAFQLLISHLDNELWNELHEDQATYDQFNQVPGIQTAIVVYINGKPAAIGCFKVYDENTVEIKRMFVEKGFRGKGLSKHVLNELEQWAVESGYQYAVLETSWRFKVAQNLYTGAGYEVIENYDPYKGLKESVCMKKKLNALVPDESTAPKHSDVNEGSPFFERKDIEYFDFEEDFVEKDIRCIPMIIRFKMDKGGIKLKLKEWNKFSVAERIELSKMPCDNDTEVKQYSRHLAGLIKKHTGNAATNLEIDQQPAWDNTYSVPVEIAKKMKEFDLIISIQEWKTLTQLQRFALMKLSRPGHESKNFIRAVKEFGLIPGDQKIEADFLSGQL